MDTIYYIRLPVAYFHLTPAIDGQTVTLTLHLISYLDISWTDTLNVLYSSVCLHVDKSRSILWREKISLDFHLIHRFSISTHFHQVKYYAVLLHAADAYREIMTIGNSRSLGVVGVGSLLRPALALLLFVVTLYQCRTILIRAYTIRLHSIETYGYSELIILCFALYFCFCIYNSSS